MSRAADNVPCAAESRLSSDTGPAQVVNPAKCLAARTHRAALVDLAKAPVTTAAVAAFFATRFTLEGVLALARVFALGRDFGFVVLSDAAVLLRPMREEQVDWDK